MNGRRAVVAGALVVAFAAIGFGVGFLPIPPTDLDLFFWPSAQAALAGHPLSAYSPGEHQPYPNANGPVALVPLTAIGAVVQALGLMGSFHPRRAIALAFFSLFIVLMAREAVAAIDRLRGEPLVGRTRLLAYAAVAAGPPVWHAVAGYGHIEQPIEVWLTLLAVRWLDRGSVARSGIAYGLTVLTRSAAGLLGLPLALHALRGGPRRPALMLGVAAGTAAAGLLPFLLADPAGLVHSLFTYRSGLVIGAGSIWSETTGTGLATVGQHADVAFVVALAVAINIWFFRAPGGLADDRLFAALALTTACFALLAKTVWPYYFMETYVFATVWALGRWRTTDRVSKLVVAPAAVSVLGLIAEYGSTPGLAEGAVKAEGAAMFVLLGAFMLWMTIEAARPFRPIGADASLSSGQIDRSSISHA